MTTHVANGPPAVVLGAVASGLAVIRSLGERGVRVTSVTYSDKDYAQNSRHVTQTWRAPRPEDDEEGFVGLLVSLAQRLDERAVLIPTNDEDLAAAARNKALLAQHYTVACMDWKVVQRVIDKRGTYEVAERVGVATPRTFVPESLPEVHDSAEILGYPCLAKPRQSHRYAHQFNCKMVKAMCPEELERAWIEAVTAGHSMLVQEFIPGEDTAGVNYNAYFSDGAPLAECTARKVRLTPPELGCPRVVVTEDVPEIVEPARALLRELGVAGFANVEFKRDARDGRYKLMEVNGRHNRSALLSVRAGVDFPWLEYCDLIGSPLPAFDAYRLGLYWIHGLSDVRQSVRQRRRERYRLREYARPYLRPHVFDAFELRDPGPLAAQLRSWIRRQAGRGGQGGAGADSTAADRASPAAFAASARDGGARAPDG